MKFRKKPVVIEAMRFAGDASTGAAIIRWAHTGLAPEHNAIIRFADLAGYHMLTIRTLEGEMRAVNGDWIIRGVKGEFYPCKPDIFDATYELAELPVRCHCNDIETGDLAALRRSCQVHGNA